jgi:RNA polymerase sigma-70 factor, ECF subfamily
MNQSDSPDLQNLIRESQRGDLKAQDALIRLYQGRVAAFIYAMTGRSDLVEDLAQIIFIKMVMKLPSLRETNRFESWLFRLARNAYMDHYRHERIRNFFVQTTEDHNEVPAPEVKTPARLEELTTALQKLPPTQRELLVLLQESDWSYEELAEMTGSSVSSVKSRLFRARSELKRLLPHET